MIKSLLLKKKLFSSEFLLAKPSIAKFTLKSWVLLRSIFRILIFISFWFPKKFFIIYNLEEERSADANVTGRLMLYKLHIRHKDIFIHRF